jgi:hypothetical protein
MKSACDLALRCLLVFLRGLFFEKRYANRDIVAAADFETDEVVFSIPRSSILNVNNVFAGQETGASKEALLQMPSWLVCTLSSFVLKIWLMIL